MNWFYRIALNIAIPFGLIGLFFRGFRNPEYRRRWRERFGMVPAEVARKAPYDFWIHAVSVGEARAAAPLVESLLSINPKLNILVTTTTPTGSAMVKMQLQEKVAHCYFPYDLAWAMRRFANTISAKTVLVMETEIWPNMIASVKRAGSRLIYINVRLSEKSYKSYARFGNWVSQTLRQIDHFAVQGEQDRRHLIALGVDENRITQTGSIKFDVSIDADLLERADELRQQLGRQRLVWIAGSTRDNEEATILESYQTLKRQFAELLLVIVPRHPERFDVVAKQVSNEGFELVRRTEHQGQELGDRIDVYLGDTMGELSLMYAAADIAFVGGSLAPLGGQNILEPCALGVPVVFGSHMFNFPDISRWAIQQGAGKQVADGHELSSAIAEILSNSKLKGDMGNSGREFVRAHRGALDKNILLLKKLDISKI